jgi:hypothetical protein
MSAIWEGCNGIIRLLIVWRKPLLAGSRDLIMIIMGYKHTLRHKDL